MRDWERDRFGRQASTTAARANRKQLILSSLWDWLGKVNSHALKTAAGSAVSARRAPRPAVASTTSGTPAAVMTETIGEIPSPRMGERSLSEIARIAVAAPIPR